MTVTSVAAGAGTWTLSFTEGADIGSYSAIPYLLVFSADQSLVFTQCVASTVVAAEPIHTDADDNPDDNPDATLVEALH